MTLDSTFLFKTASSSTDPFLEDDTTRVPDKDLLKGPTNSRVVVVPIGYKRTPTSKPTSRELLVYCNNRKKIIDQYTLSVAHYNGVWHQVVPRATGFYRKEPKPSISTFDTYDLEEVLKEVKELSPVDEDFPPFEEPEKAPSDDSDNEPNDDSEDNQIRNSPIVTSPPPYTLLPAPTMASTSTTTLTTTAQASTAPKPPPSSPSQIVTKFHQSFNLPGSPTGGGGGCGGGGSGGGGGGGGPPAPLPPQQPQQQQNVAPAADVKAMGKLPDTFNGDRTKAEDFIEEVKGYLRLNQDVAGFNSPMKKVAFMLTHMKGPKVANWVKTMGETIEGLDPLVDNIPAVWTTFLDMFNAQYQDSTKEEKARAQLKNLKMRGNVTLCGAFGR